MPPKSRKNYHDIGIIHDLLILFCDTSCLNQTNEIAINSSYNQPFLYKLQVSISEYLKKKKKVSIS